MAKKVIIKEKVASPLQIQVIRGKVLGVSVYRGFAELGILTDISQADIYDMKDNPLGTQRDLSPKHAKEAYEYVKNGEIGFWPEVFLCARNNDILTFKPILDDFPDMGVLHVDTQEISRSRKVIISRVDGNHRLNYGNGKEKGFSRIHKEVSFCLAYDLKKDEEIQLFKDINKNQKAMNTSHLDGIEVRLSPEEELKRRSPISTLRRN